MTALSPRTIEILRRCAAAAEQAGRLLPEQLALIYEQKWFRMMVPRRYGGMALPLPEVVRIEEEIARTDGSAGWTVTLCAGAGWFAGFFPPPGFPGFFSDEHMCVAGSGAPSGQAHEIAGGYRISGRWQYASGALHATGFTANCTIWSDGQPVLTDDGRPLVQPFLFFRDEVRVIEDWKAMGMVATGSHGFEVWELEVSSARKFVVDAAAAADDDPLYRYPFLPLAEATLAVNLSGMMLHFLDCCEWVFADRIGRGGVGSPRSEEMLDVLDEAREAVGVLREEFYAVLDDSWSTMEPQSFGRVSRASLSLVEGVRGWCDRLYPYAGLGAARVDTEINRVWRDLHTAGQHPLLVFELR